MTMIRPKIKGLPMTKPKSRRFPQQETIGKKAKGTREGEFLGTSKMVS
jgi:hypothetical protein